MNAKVITIARDEVGQIRVLGVIPDLLGGVEIWRVGRKPFHMDRGGMSIQVSTQDLGTVDIPSVEDEDEFAANIPPQRTQEGYDMWTADVLRVNLPVETESKDVSRKSDGTDNRQAIMTSPRSQNRSLALWCPRSTDYRLKHEAAFVNEHDASAFPASVFLYAAIAADASVRFVPRRVLWLAVRVSGSSSPICLRVARHEKGGKRRHTPS